MISLLSDDIVTCVLVIAGVRYSVIKEGDLVAKTATMDRSSCTPIRRESLFCDGAFDQGIQISPWRRYTLGTSSFFTDELGRLKRKGLIFMSSCTKLHRKGLD